MSIKRWYLLHKWTSLVCTLFALLLCLTGLSLIFSHEIDHALDYGVEPPAMAETGQRTDPDIVIADAKARNPGHAVQFLVVDPDEPDVWFVRMGTTADAAEASAFYIYDARTGKFLQEYPLDEGVMTVLLRLHIDLFAGLPGMLFLGFMGALLLVSLISGTVLYGFYMRKLRFGSVRRTGSIQVMWLDLHNLLGIVTLVWLFVVGITGVCRFHAGRYALDVQTAHAGADRCADREFRRETRISGICQRAVAVASSSLWRLWRPAPQNHLGAAGYAEYCGARKRLIPVAEKTQCLTRITIQSASKRKGERFIAGSFYKTLGFRMKAPLAWMQIWGAPIVLGLLTASGLITALLSDGVGDVLSWVVLTVPVAVALWRALRQA